MSRRDTPILPPMTMNRVKAAMATSPQTTTPGQETAPGPFRSEQW